MWEQPSFHSCRTGFNYPYDYAFIHRRANIEERIARLEGSFEQIERRLGTVEQDLRSLRAEMTARFDRLDSRVDRLIYWQLGLMGAIAASIVATLLTQFL